jgi:hypothetical protein
MVDPVFGEIKRPVVVTIEIEMDWNSWEYILVLLSRWLKYIDIHDLIYEMVGIDKFQRVGLPTLHDSGN